MPNFNIRSTYNFDVYAPNILGNSFKGATILAIMDAESALKESDVISKHAAIYSYLPAGTPNSWSSYDYVKIKTKTNEISIIGMPWIVQNTIELVESRTAIVTIAGVTGSDASRIRNALISNGFNNIQITIN